MKTWQKILIAAVCGAAIYGLGFAATVWTNWSMIFNGAAALAASVCTLITGFSKPQA